MSKHLYCDQCDALMFKVAGGTQEFVRFSLVLEGRAPLIFCSKKCLLFFVSESVSGAVQKVMA